MAPALSKFAAATIFGGQLLAVLDIDSRGTAFARLILKRYRNREQIIQDQAKLKLKSKNKAAALPPPPPPAVSPPAPAPALLASSLRFGFDQSCAAFEHWCATPEDFRETGDGDRIDKAHAHEVAKLISGKLRWPTTSDKDHLAHDLNDLQKLRDKIKEVSTHDQQSSFDRKVRELQEAAESAYLEVVCSGAHEHGKTALKQAIADAFVTHFNKLKQASEKRTPTTTKAETTTDNSWLARMDRWLEGTSKAGVGAVMKFERKKLPSWYNGTQATVCIYKKHRAFFQAIETLLTVGLAVACLLSGCAEFLGGFEALGWR